MPDDDWLNEHLRRFLQREEDEPVRQLLSSMSAKVIEIERLTAERHGELEDLIKAHDYRIQTLERSGSKLEKDFEDTGRHHLASIRAKSKRYEDLAWLVVRTGILLLLGGGVVELIHRLAAH